MDLGIMARMEMESGNYQQALNILSLALSQPRSAPIAGFLLADRADCLWELGKVHAAVQEMMTAIQAGLSSDEANSENEAFKWSGRSRFLFEKQDYHLAELCASFALHFRVFSPSAGAQPLLCRALSRYNLGNPNFQSDINQVKQLDKKFAKTSAQKQKNEAIEEYHQQNYKKSLKLFDLALLLHPEDNSGVKFRRSVESHQAAAHFKLTNYRKALEVGEKSCNSNPSYKSTDEAERWKERGKPLSKDSNLVDLAIGCYSLALKYTPPEKKDLTATILSNRSLMYQRARKDKEALCDAKQCVENKPDWAKEEIGALLAKKHNNSSEKTSRWTTSAIWRILAELNNPLSPKLADKHALSKMNLTSMEAQYRLGSCLFACNKYSEALESFSRSLHLLLEDSSSAEKEKLDTLKQILSVAQNNPGGTSGIHYDVPPNLVQVEINKAVNVKDWQRLYFLFMGGGGEKRFQKGSGGLGIGCDASSVPLEEVIPCDFPEMAKFISVLLDHKAIASAQEGCKSPLDVAIDLKKFDVVNLLLEKCNKTLPTEVKFATSAEPHKRTYKDDGLEALRKGDNKKVLELLQISLKQQKGDVREQRDTLKLLCELYFKEKSFSKCLETGRKLKASLLKENHEENNSLRVEWAKQWKNWGNELYEENKYDLMAEFNSLAMEFTPESNKDFMKALLSNRCLAYINLNKYKEALEDAEKCIKTKPQWFRGHSRRGNCLLKLKRQKEALEAFCKGHSYASSEREKNFTAKEVISTAMELPDEETRICNFSPRTIEFLVKEASKNLAWKELRFLYLGNTANDTSKGIAIKCEASCVPLELLIESDVKDLHRLVSRLLECGALPDGVKGCKRPPLLTAMELMKFPIAVTLLRNKADPSCVIGNETFINREGQSKQWFRLGHKAFANEDLMKAVMFFNMCLHLSDSSTEPSILIQTNHTLAEAYFKRNEHELAVSAGKECFRLRSVKSEEEAKRWQVRASQVFSLGLYKLCVECVNLGLKYTPVESKQTFSRFLCQRSEAKQQLGDYVRGLDDARSALKMTSELLEGYLNQFRCLRALKNEKEAMQAANECLKRTTDETLLGELLSEVLDVAVNLKDGTTAITTLLPNHILLKLMNDVIRIKDFNKLKILFLGGGGPLKHPVGAGGLVASADARSVPLGEVIRRFGPEEALISVLLGQGASVNVTEGSDVIPLEEAIRKENLPLVEKLVQRGANCCAVSIDGEPMVHKAMRIGLKSGNFRFLEAMVISKCSEMQNVHDNQGDTLYHLVCAGKKCTANKCNAIKILRKANINPNLPNMKNVLPLDMVNKSDSRWKMINNDVKSYTSNSSTHSSFEVEPANTPSNGHYHEELFTANEDQTVAGEPFLKEEETSLPKKVHQICKTDDKEQQKIQRRQRIAALIDALSPIEAFVPVETVEEQEDNNMLDNSFVAPDNTDQDQKQQPDELAPTPSDTSDKHSETEEKENELAEDDADTEIDSKTPFEKLLWEVDCTDQVWKKMRSRNVDSKTRKQFVNKIRMLANGRWNNEKLCKRLEGVSKKEGIQLYETRLTRGHRILWEKAIAFSGRLSDDPDSRLKEGTSGGRMYTEIIRVWDIVFDHDKIARSVEHIVKSRARGMDCLVKKRLKGISVESRNDSTLSSECIPNMYEEIEDLNHSTKPLSKNDAKDKASRSFFPPASPNEQEYHIHKFYTFNTQLERSVLESDTSTKVDFPFKITELEHAVVNLRPKPPTSIILLGRSGTGKTTCCLYRLWVNFKTYWESAATAGPYILKHPHHVKSLECGTEQEPLQRSSEQGACGQDITTLATKLHRVDDYADSCIDDSTQDHSNETNGYENSHVHLSKLGSQCEDYISSDSDAPRLCDHLHQIFITKNTVLCSEVEKNFNELSRAFSAGEQRLRFEDQPTSARIQDVAEEKWPLFVSSRDWLLMLDASLPGEKFFKRSEDGSLELKIEGWGEDSTYLHFIPDTESDEESDEQKDEEVLKTEEDNDEPIETKKEPKSKRDPRREITYQVFQNEIWPKMKKTLKEKEKNYYNPTLVWTEIRSFIKGSDEALMSENGFLSLKDYETLGRKKAPNFSADRKVVYELFREYQLQRLRNRMFDEADLVFNIHRRLQSSPVPEWSVHRFYVDETQDFTQAELSIIIRCCRFPNLLFFTGDTAQSIMRGIAFRFNDLRTLFHRNKEGAIKEGKPDDDIRVPKIYQLTHNYRSHAGILRLASSVVDLLLRYFPDSFDRLQKDEGLFEGPKPVLLEACSPTDLALILQGNQRQRSRIEFGAHQVVLVVSNEAREAMPDELKQGLVMTIYEAKGLEFDDVLIYNFFKDSQAGKEWRVVTSFVEQQNMADASSSTGLTEITEESIQMRHSRPLEFNPEKHKVLNSEFKFLYTAITRARVNVWFFDEDEEARAPVFEYFRRLKLVDVMTLEDQGKGTGQLANMFAVKSTPEEWRKGGIRFYKKGLWVVAIKCFTFAGDELMLQKSQAQQQAAEAIKFRSTNRQRMRDEFLRAGESFLQCQMYDEAAICLNNAREWILLAKLYEKSGKYQDAGRLFKKKGLYQEASRCFESQNNYRDAIEILCSAGCIEEALNAMERFKILSSSADLEGRLGIIPPKDTRTVERMRHQLANKHFKEGNKEKMEEVLQHLPSTNDRITFLKKRGCIIEAARVMGKDGRRDEAASLLRNQGMFQEAIRYSRDPKFTADCLLSQARTAKDTADTPGILHLALEKYQQCQDQRGQAEAMLMLGQLSNEVQKIQEAGRRFNELKNCCGEVESVAELLKTTCYSPPKHFKQWISIRALERLLRLIRLLYKPDIQRSTVELEEIQKCEEHFGLFATDSERKKVFFCKRGGRFSMVHPGFIKSNASKSEATIDTTEAHQMIGKFLIFFCATFIDMIRKMLEKTFLRSSVCRQVTEGVRCDNSSCEYQHEDSDELFNSRFHSLFNSVYLESVVEQGVSEMTENGNESDISLLSFKDFREFDACHRFYSLLFPSSGYRRHQTKVSHLRSIMMTKAVKRRLFHFAAFLWRKTSRGKRRGNTDNFLKVSTSLQLIGSSPLMVRWISEEEIQFQKLTRTSFKPTKDHLTKNGMVVKKDSDIYESYLHWWETGKKMLYMYGDVVNAAHEVVRRFLTFTAMRKGIIHPSCANAVMILELQLTACLSLYAKICTEHRYPICLPEGYLIMVRVWDNVFPNDEKGTFTLYEAVEHNACQEKNKLRLLKSTCSVLNYMVKLACGDVAHLFNVLRDALSSEDTSAYNASGVPERSLILFLTMLCNCGKGISTSVEDIMLKNLFSLKPKSYLPNRINDVLVEVQEAKGCCDVIAVFDKFLQTRGERLYDLRWHSRKLWFDGPANPNNYRKRFHNDTSIIREELGKIQKETLHHGEAVSKDEVIADGIDFDASEESIGVEYTAELLKEKENARSEVELEVAATKIQRWYRRVEQVKVFRARKLERLKSIEEQINASASTIGERFSKFKLDSSACGICGVHFASLDDNQEEYDGALPDKQVENLEDHRKSYAHSQKEEQFQKYKEIYLAEIHPCLKKEEELRNMIDNISSCGDKRLTEVVALDLERAETTLSVVKNEVQTIETSLKWENTGELLKTAKELEGSLEGLFKLLEKAKTDSVVDESMTGNDETEDQGDKLEEEGGEDSLVDMHKDLPKKRRKHKRKKRSQATDMTAFP